VSRAALAGLPADSATADATPAAPGPPFEEAAAPVAAQLADAALRLELDAQLRVRVWHLAGAAAPLTPWGTTGGLELADGRRADRFTLGANERTTFDGAHGRGVRLTLTGIAHEPRIEERLVLELCERYPGFAFVQASFRNLSGRPLKLRGWTVNALRLPHGAHAGSGGPDFWSYCGSTHSDRRDWVQPVKPGFAQDNFLGMTASDYGGGTPVVDVWRRDAGLAVGHLELHPLLVSLPVRCDAHGVGLAVSARAERTLAPGETLDTPMTFIAVHGGDYYATLDAYRRVMADRGLRAPAPPPSAYEGIWCAWGYERNCTVALIEGTLPKVRELGLGWAVIDDGWQSNVGDWTPAAQKFPGGEADLARLVERINAESLKPRLWYAPLAAAPGSDVLHDHTDMLLLDRDGAPQLISWWNSLYLCPAYAQTVAYTEDLVRRFIGTWGFAGLKVDGQHLNGVAPCYNPAHRHARPEESVEALPDFLQAIYRTATHLDPQAVVELCPCGTAYSIFNLASLNQAPASDPESSWQVRHKGKTLKALIGPGAAFAGDHVELSDGGEDWASTVGIGAVVSTKFTWPRDPKPKDSFLLTPAREASWRRWIALYNELLLPRGDYLGHLYDIGFDKPEAHVTRKDGRLYYAFYAPAWRGAVTLRGLGAGPYRVRDLVGGAGLGEVSVARNRIDVVFERFLLLEAAPVGVAAG
jgi:alpha-galactosidase